MTSNNEGEDLAVPLPKEWTLEALQSSIPVVLYESKISPPCCKIRFMLKYYNVPYKPVAGKKKGSEYQKIPVLDIGNRQVNDSYIIVKNLAPILQGRPLTDEEVELEKMVTFGLMIELERATAVSTCDLCRCAGLLGGGLSLALRSLSCCIACCIGPKIGKDKNLKTLQEYGDILRAQLKGDFFGGSEPSVMDVSIFGVLTPFCAARVSPMQVLLGDPRDPLRLWHQRMDEKSKHIHVF